MVILVYCLILFIIVLIAKKPTNALKNDLNINTLDQDFKALETQKNALQDKLDLIESQIDTLDSLLLVINEQLDYTMNDNKRSQLLAKKVSTLSKLEKLQDKHKQILADLDNLDNII